MSKIDNSIDSIDTFLIEQDIYSEDSHSMSEKMSISKNKIISKIVKIQKIQKVFKKIYTHIKLMISNIINDILKNKDESGSLKKERLKYCIEFLISNIHESISELDDDSKPAFKLYVQEYKNNNPKYDIGSGSSDDENPDFGNLNNLYPQRFDLYEIKDICSDSNLKNLPSALFYIPCFLILYDLENIELKIKYFWLNIGTDLKLDKSIYYLLEKPDTKWKVLDIIPKLEELNDEILNERKFSNEIEKKIIFNDDVFDLLNMVNIFFKITTMNIQFLKTRRLIY